MSNDIANGKFEIIGQGHSDLRPEQHNRKVPQLPPGPPVHLRHQCVQRRVRSCDQPICLHCPAPRDPDIRNGDYLLPLFQQGRRESRQGVFNHPDFRPHDFSLVRRPCGGFPEADLDGHGLPRPSGLHLDDGLDRRDRCFPVYPLCLSPLQETSSEVRGPEAWVHIPEHPSESHLFRLPSETRSQSFRNLRRRHPGRLGLLHQPLLHRLHDYLLRR